MTGSSGYGACATCLSCRRVLPAAPTRATPRGETGLSKKLTILGIESSCDDTGASVVRRDVPGKRVLSNVVMSQDRLHEAFGGVVPEIAARAHAEKLDLAVEAALAERKWRLVRSMPLP